MPPTKIPLINRILKRSDVLLSNEAALARSAGRGTDGEDGGG
jgi:hypothetical protein